MFFGQNTIMQKLKDLQINVYHGPITDIRPESLGHIKHKGHL